MSTTDRADDRRSFPWGGGTQLWLYSEVVRTDEPDGTRGTLRLYLDDGRVRILWTGYRWKDCAPEDLLKYDQPGLWMRGLC